MRIGAVDAIVADDQTRSVMEALPNTTGTIAPAVFIIEDDEDMVIASNLPS